MHSLSLSLRLMVQLSLLSTLPVDSGLLAVCAELGVTPTGYPPLGLGILSGKYDLDRLPDGPRGLIFKALLPSCQPLLGTLRGPIRSDLLRVVRTR